MKQVIRGNEAAALGAKLARVKVISAYPITPQSEVVEKLAEFVADGELDAEFMKVESEHSALSACIGAAAAGVRTFTATASQGLMLLSEMMYTASGLRLPIVMVNVNRSLSAPISIWCFTKDAMVLMGDLTHKPISEVKEGDTVLGKDKKGNLRFAIVNQLFRRRAENLMKLKTDKFDILCTPEHKFYYHPTHNHWIRAKSLKNKLLPWFGFGFNNESEEFKGGWLSGIADGNGGFLLDKQGRHSFRINVKDDVIVDTFVKYCSGFGFDARKTDYRIKEGLFTGIITRTGEATKLKKFLEFSKNADFCRGYLAGMYDAEDSGPHKERSAVIYNGNREIQKKISEALDSLEIKHKTYVDKRSMNYHIEVMYLNFSLSVDLLQRGKETIC